MDLDSLRKEINQTDSIILSAFEKRMELCRQVAIYKKEHDMPVFQSQREKEIIEKVKDKSPKYLKSGTAALFTQIMDISKCLQQQELLDGSTIAEPVPLRFSSEDKIACQGVSGSNSEAAAKKLFKENSIDFYPDFEDIFFAVTTGKARFGILPINNSTAGSITRNYDLMRKYSVYIAKTIKLEINHCLAAKPGTDLKDISKVYSHIQALSQCSEFIKSRGLEPVEAINTAAAAQYVSEMDEHCAAICSESCAELYGLEILEKNISNVIPNYTKFICISKDFCISEDADEVSVNLKLPNTKGSLYRILTKFYMNDLNLKNLESRPVADGSFDIMFYLDFEGNFSSQKVRSLLAELADELEYFRFLGNYSEIS